MRAYCNPGEMLVVVAVDWLGECIDYPGQKGEREDGQLVAVLDISRQPVMIFLNGREALLYKQAAPRLGY